MTFSVVRGAFNFLQFNQTWGVVNGSQNILSTGFIRPYSFLGEMHHAADLATGVGVG